MCGMCACVCVCLYWANNDDDDDGYKIKIIMKINGPICDTIMGIKIMKSGFWLFLFFCSGEENFAKKKMKDTERNSTKAGCAKKDGLEWVFLCLALVLDFMILEQL
jgi:hypothetical protein